MSENKDKFIGKSTYLVINPKGDVGANPTGCYFFLSLFKVSIFKNKMFSFIKKHFIEQFNKKLIDPKRYDNKFWCVCLVSS